MQSNKEVGLASLSGRSLQGNSLKWLSSQERKLYFIIISLHTINIRTGIKERLCHPFESHLGKIVSVLLGFLIWLCHDNKRNLLRNSYSYSHIHLGLSLLLTFTSLSSSSTPFLC